MKNIKWGIIGLGNIANKFAQAITKMTNCELSGVSSRSKEKSIEFGKNYGVSIEKCYGTYEELIKDKEIDTIYIAVPHTLHKDLSILCLQNKKAVLCEKPVTINKLELEEVIMTAKENNTFFMEAMKTRFLPVHIKVLELIKNGEIGEVKLLQGDFGFSAPFDENSRLFDKNLGGGSLLDVGIYCLSYAAYIFGNEVKNVRAHGNIRKTGVDEDVSMTLTYDSGAIAQLYSSISLNSKRDANIVGTKGIITVPRFSNGEKLILTKGNIVEEMNFPFEINGFEYEIEEVNKCLRSNKLESEIMSWEDSLKVMEMLDKVMKEVYK